MDESQQARLLSVTLKLKKLLDSGALGPKAASTGNTLTSGVLLDLVWELIFGRPLEEMTDKDSGAAFVLSVWKGHPVIGWHLHHIQTHEVIGLLAMTVAIVGNRIGKDIIDDVILALKALKERQDIEDATDGQTKN